MRTAVSHGEISRPALLEAAGFFNTQPGDLSAVYGMQARLRYFPGGLLEDRFGLLAAITTCGIVIIARLLWLKKREPAK